MCAAATPCPSRTGRAGERAGILGEVNAVGLASVAARPGSLCPAFASRSGQSVRPVDSRSVAQDRNNWCRAPGSPTLVAWQAIQPKPGMS
jgi:hypothetical protein